MQAAILCGVFALTCSVWNHSLTCSRTRAKVASGSSCAAMSFSVCGERKAVGAGRLSTVHFQGPGCAPRTENIDMSSSAQDSSGSSESASFVSSSSSGMELVCADSMCRCDGALCFNPRLSLAFAVCPRVRWEHSQTCSCAQIDTRQPTFASVCHRKAFHDTS